MHFVSHHRQLLTRLKQKKKYGDRNGLAFGEYCTEIENSVTISSSCAFPFMCGSDSTCDYERCFYDSDCRQDYVNYVYIPKRCRSTGDYRLVLSVEHIMVGRPHQKNLRLQPVFLCQHHHHCLLQFLILLS